MNNEKDKNSNEQEKTEELKREIIQEVQKYLDSKINPILKYFEKKKDYNEMNYL